MHKTKVPGAFLYLFLFFISSQTQKAQDSLTFKECLNLGIERNFSIRIIKNEEKITENNLKWAKGGFLPALDLSLRQNYSILNSERVFFSNPDSSRISNNARSNSLNSGANINWTVFDGLGMFYRYEALQQLNETGKLTTRLNVENLIAMLGSLYYDYLQQSKRLETFKYVMSLSRERMNVAEERYRIGRESKLQFQQAKVDYNSDSSRFMQQYEDLLTSKIRLNEALALNLDTQSFIQESIRIDFGLVYDDLLQQTTQNNTSILIAANAKNLSELEKKQITSRMYPSLDLTSGYIYNKSSAQSGVYLSSRESGFNYGFAVTFPLLNGLDLQRQRQNAKINIENSQLEYEQVELSVLADLSILYNVYQNSLSLVALEESNLQIARDNFNIATERFNLGTMSGLEMRDIQRAYLDAEDRVLAAQYQAKLAEISLKQISGRISEYL